jgi:hypothetical protein
MPSREEHVTPSAVSVLCLNVESRVVLNDQLKCIMICWSK